MPTWSTGQASAPANEITNYGTGIAGFSPTVRATGPQHFLGQTVRSAGNYLWMYIKASTALASTATLAAPVTVSVAPSTALATTGATVTMTIASPGVVTWTAHGLITGDAIEFQTTGALPTGVTAGTTYYVGTVPSVDTFQFSATRGGAAVNTSGSQSGTHTATRFPFFAYAPFAINEYGWVRQESVVD